MKRLALSSIVFGTLALMATYTARVQAYADDKSEITAVEQRLLEGFTAKDANKIMSGYTPDESLFVFDMHEHNSVPVDFASGKADLAAKP
jgi:ketosteroid isomerase-like protein